MKAWSFADLPWGPAHTQMKRSNKCLAAATRADRHDLRAENTRLLLCVGAELLLTKRD